MWQSVKISPVACSLIAAFFLFFSVYLEKLVFRNLKFLEVFYLSHYWT